MRSPLVAPSNQDDQGPRSTPGSPSATQAPNASAAQSIHADATTAFNQPAGPTRSLQDSRRLFAARASPVGSPNLSAAGPPSSRIRSNDANANSPAYSLLELEAHLSPQVSQTLQLYFHRQWKPQSNGPAVLHFRDGSIKRLAGPVDVAAAPYVRLVPPVDLFTVDDGVDDSDGASNTHDGDDNTSNSASSIHHGDDNTSGSEGSTHNQLRELVIEGLLTVFLTILALFSVACLLLPLSAWGIQRASSTIPAPVLFPIHQPILQLAVNLNSAADPSSAAWDLLPGRHLELLLTCAVPQNWTKFCRGSSDGLYDGARRFGDDHDPTRKRFHGATDQVMCSIALNCAEMKSAYDKVRNYMINIKHAYLWYDGNPMAQFTTNIQSGLKQLKYDGLEPASSSIATNPVIHAYLWAFEEKGFLMGAETIHEVDVIRTAGRMYTTKSPIPWQYITRNISYHVTVIELARNISDCFDGLVQTLQHLEGITSSFRNDFRSVPTYLDAMNQAYFLREEVDSLSNVTEISEIRQNLEPIAKRILTSHHQLVALHSALSQMAWPERYRLRSIFPFNFKLKGFGYPVARRVEWQQDLDFWSSIWIAVGLMENGQGQDHTWPYLKSQFLAGIVDSLRPRFSVVVPPLQTQIDGLDEALSILKKMDGREWPSPNR